MQALSETLASVEAYRAEHGPFLRELRCQTAVREHLENLLPSGDPLPLFPPVSTSVPLIDDDDVAAGMLRFVYDDGSTVEHMVLAPAAAEMTLSNWANSLLPPEIAAAGLHWEWVEQPDPVETLAGANQRADERIAEWRERMAHGFNGILASLDGDLYPEAEPQPRGMMAQVRAYLDADEERELRNTPRPDAMICAHVCGPDPDHECQAAATTTLEHQNLAGGVTRLPLCGPCHLAETATLEATCE
jgi:hypothetical protein